MKGFKKDGKFRPTGNKTKSSLKRNDLEITVNPKSKTQEIEIKERKKKTVETPDDRYEDAINRIKKEWEKALEEHFKDDPHFKGKKWLVDLDYTGNNGNLETFGFSAQAEGWGEDNKFVSEHSWISNDEWMGTGDFDEDEKLEKEYEKNPQKAEDDYTDWMTSTVEIAEDGWYMQLLDAIEDEIAEGKEGTF